MGATKAEIAGLDEERFDLEVAGAAEARATGTARNVRVDISGAGKVRTTDLRAVEAAVSIAGAGEVHVHAADKLEVSIAGAGNVRFAGDPVVSQSIAGVGSVQRIE